MTREPSTSFAPRGRDKSPDAPRRRACAAALALLAATLAKAEPSPERSADPLQRVVSVAWQDQTLDDGLRRLAATTGAVLWIDRRVARDAVLDVRERDVAVRDLIGRLSAPEPLGAARVGPLLYVGPRESAIDLSAALVEGRRSLLQAPPRVRRAWLAVVPCRWPRRAQPRAILEGLASQSGAAVVDDAGLIEFDIWEQRDGPMVARIDQASLIAAGFGARCRVEGRGAKLVVTASPRKPTGDQPMADVARPPRASHQGQAALASPARDLKSVRLTLKVRGQALGLVLEELTRQIGLEVQWSDSANELSPPARQRLASCDVVDADVDALLAELATTARVRLARTGRRVVVSAP